QSLDAATDVVVATAVEEMRDARMGPARRAIDPLRLRLAIGAKDVAHAEEGESHAFRVAQRQRALPLEPARERLGHVQHDGDRPESAVGQAHGTADGLMVRATEEAPQGREAAVEQQLEVAELPRSEVPG